MVFVETKRQADFIAAFLCQEKVPTTSIHGYVHACLPPGAVLVLMMSLVPQRQRAARAGEGAGGFPLRQVSRPGGHLGGVPRPGHP